MLEEEYTVPFAFVGFGHGCGGGDLLRCCGWMRAG